MITKYDKYFEDYMSAGDGPPPRRHREPIPYKQVVMTFLSQDFKDLVEKTKDSYDWDKFIDHCEKAEKLPYVCASNLKERLLNTIREDIIKGVNPKLLDERDKPKDIRPKERFLKPRPESKEYQELQSKATPKKTIDYSDRNRHLYDGGPFGDDVFDDENWGSAYEGMFIKFENFINETIEPIKDEPVLENLDQVEKLSDGKIKYRGEIFDGFNKPKQYRGKGKFKKRVLAKEGDKIKIVNYGHRDYEDYTTHGDSERRKNFRKRHGCDPVSNLSKLTAKYWACQDLW